MGLHYSNFTDDFSDEVHTATEMRALEDLLILKDPHTNIIKNRLKLKIKPT